MRVVTWNVNSLRARMPRMEELLTQHQPDVVLLQETKVSPEQFPHAELAALGYHAVDSSSDGGPSDQEDHADHSGQRNSLVHAYHGA